MKNNDPSFVEAFKELLAAYESYDKNDYKNAVLNAEKSYESVLKVVLNDAEGAVDSLLGKLINIPFFIKTFPKTMSKGGFKDKILSSLPYIRNLTKVGHGSGSEDIDISKSLTRLSLNLSCTLSSCILYCYSEKTAESPRKYKKIDEDLPF
jgi:hypothetical protein